MRPRSGHDRPRGRMHDWKARFLLRFKDWTQGQELARVGLTAGSAIQGPREQKATPNVV